MRIAFRVDYSSKIGLGHLTRMSALADIFTERGCECTFFNSQDEPVNYSAFDIVIVDTYLVDDNYISALRDSGCLTICCDDNSLYRYDCDVLINANLYAQELAFRFGAEIPRLLLGGKYALLRKEFRESEPVTVRESANRVFVCFGGTDLRNNTPEVVGALQTIPDIELTVVLGKMTACDEAVRKLSGVNVQIIKNPQSMSEVMRGCDVAVTAAGSMAYELASLGLPSLLIVQAENQSKIAEYMNRKGLMRCAGGWNNFDAGRLRGETIDILSDFQRRLSESRLLRQTVDKNGVCNIVDAILEMVK